MKYDFIIVAIHCNPQTRIVERFRIQRWNPGIDPEVDPVEVDRTTMLLSTDNNIDLVVGKPGNPAQVNPVFKVIVNNLEYFRIDNAQLDKDYLGDLPEF